MATHEPFQYIPSPEECPDLAQQYIEHHVDYGRRVIHHAATISKAKRRRVYERDGYRCVRCGATEDLTLDHIQPRSRGGSNADDNLQTLCRSCNSSKGARDE